MWPSCATPLDQKVEERRLQAAGKLAKRAEEKASRSRLKDNPDPLLLDLPQA